VRLGSAEGEERQQIKWFAYAAAVLFGTFLIVISVESLEGTWTMFVVIVPGLSGVPVAVGIAILKHRLYDIDRIINRTLVYGSLTALLALVYFAGVATTQAIFRGLTGQEEQPQLAIVVSTLVIAALFNPLRRRIQGIIDRRFYRRNTTREKL
jgi:isoprenylcysteine carboxyl methyltransferase (ICMT) family protein YpbQ